MKVWKVSIPSYAETRFIALTESSIDGVLNEMISMETGEGCLRIDCVEMTQEEFDALPEFDGW